MLEIKTNIDTVIGGLSQQLQKLLNTDALLRTIATSMTGVVRARVHEKGLTAAGVPIGTYDKDYLEQRQKPPYNRTADPKIVFSLTRQMENDMKPIPTVQGWAIGYSNQHNHDKAMWCEMRENTKILTALTKEEDAQVTEIVTDFVDDALKSL